MTDTHTYIGTLIAGTVLLPLPLLLLLLQLLDTLLQDVGPEVALEVRQLLGAGQAVLRCLFEDILRKKKNGSELVSAKKVSFQRADL